MAIQLNNRNFSIELLKSLGLDNIPGIADITLIVKPDDVVKVEITKYLMQNEGEELIKTFYSNQIKVTED